MATIPAFDGQIDRRTDGRTAFSSLDRVCIPRSAVKVSGSELSTAANGHKIIAIDLIRLAVGFAFMPSEVFTALHGMQTRSNDENSVHLSVCPFVKRVICDKMEERSAHILYHTNEHLA